MPQFCRLPPVWGAAIGAIPPVAGLSQGAWVGVLHRAVAAVATTGAVGKNLCGYGPGSPYLGFPWADEDLPIDPALDQGDGIGPYPEGYFPHAPFVDLPTALRFYFKARAMSISGVSSGFGLIPDADPAGYQYGYTDPVAQTGEAVAADTPEARQFPAAPGLLRFTAGNFSYSFQAYRGQKYRIGLNAFDLATGAALTLTYGPTPPNYADAPYDFTYQNFNLNGQNWWYSDYSREDYNYPGHEAGTQNIAAASLDFFA